MRLRAIRCALWFGVRPYWMYEGTPHYAPMSYRRHLAMNLAYAWSWLTFRETAEDRAFEVEVNGSKKGVEVKVIKAVGRTARAIALGGLEAIAAHKEKVVTFLTPLVFAPLASAAAVLAGKYFPGVDLPTDKLVGLGITGFAGAVAAAITWLRGTQKERDNAAAVKAAALQSTNRAPAVAAAATAVANELTTPVGGEAPPTEPETVAHHPV